MVGKKASLPALRQLLQHYKVNQVSVSIETGRWKNVLEIKGNVHFVIEMI